MRSQGQSAISSICSLNTKSCETSKETKQPRKAPWVYRSYSGKGVWCFGKRVRIVGQSEKRGMGIEMKLSTFVNQLQLNHLILCIKVDWPSLPLNLMCIRYISCQVGCVLMRRQPGKLKGCGNITTLRTTHWNFSMKLTCIDHRSFELARACHLYSLL